MATNRRLRAVIIAGSALAVVAAVGIGVATVMANRFAAIQWEKAMGAPAPGKGPRVVGRIS